MLRAVLAFSGNRLSDDMVVLVMKFRRRKHTRPETSPLAPD